MRETLLDQAAAFSPGMEPRYGLGDGTHACSFPRSLTSIFIGQLRGNSSFDLPFSPATFAAKVISRL
jgi:hypothetical protein